MIRVSADLGPSAALCKPCTSYGNPDRLIRFWGTEKHGARRIATTCCIYYLLAGATRPSKRLLDSFTNDTILYPGASNAEANSVIRSRDDLR